MTQINSIIRKELLKRAKDSKLYIMTNLTAISNACNVYSSEVTLNIQKMFLTCDTNFTYDLSQTRNGVKIVALELFNLDVYSIEYLTEKKGEEALAIYILSQFANKLPIEDIKKIFEFYKALYSHTDLTNVSDNALYFAITKENDRIYNQIIDFNKSKEEIDYLLDLIVNNGYAFIKGDYIFWKTYSPNANLSDKDAKDAFTVIVNKPFEETPQKESVKEILEVEKFVDTPLTVSKAISFLAKEFGLTLDEDESKNKLEEMVAMTNELIMNFNDLQDWEKLKSWDKFVKDWQTIMGEAMNDRN